MPRADRRIGELLGLFRAEKADVAVGVAVERTLVFVKEQVVFPPVELKKIGERLVRLGKLRARRKLEAVVVDTKGPARGTAPRRCSSSARRSFSTRCKDVSARYPGSCRLSSRLSVL